MLLEIKSQKVPVPLSIYRKQSGKCLIKPILANSAPGISQNLLFPLCGEIGRADYNLGSQFYSDVIQTNSYSITINFLDSFISRYHGLSSCTTYFRPYTLSAQGWNLHPKCINFQI